MKHLQIFNVGENMLPHTWSSSEDDMNPQAEIVPNIARQVIKICTTDLDKLVKQDYEN